MTLPGAGHEFHNDLVIQLYAAAAAAGYELVLSGITPGRGEAQAVQELMSLRCDGLILIGPTMKAADLDAVGRLTPTGERGAVGVRRNRQRPDR